MMKKPFIFLIRVYQLVISPLIGPRCRYYPTCSHYAIEAIQLHGPIKGCFLAARRVLRCHPGQPGGYDPVPGSESCTACEKNIDHAVPAQNKNPGA